MSERHLLQHHYGGWNGTGLPEPRAQIADHSGIKVLAERDPRKEMQHPYDQSTIGSCTANETAGAIEYDAIVGGKHLGTPSRLDIYYGERVTLEHQSAAEDTGAYVHDGMKFANKYGWIPEKDWPYDVAKFADAPPADAAHRHKIGAYKTVTRSMAAFKAVLSNQQTVGIGFSVFESFESDEVANTGIMPVPDVNSEQLLGGHAVLVVGYLKSEPNYALVRNSWGVNWGMGGYFLMPWAIILDRNMSDDFVTIWRAAK